ncbi:sulfate transporter family-domain-containing protein [Mycena rosella]|uniref:Sulfate transporter family-domain-containing protein n=1 Tax=Mycena rosella TaxID=1033263 RepID=A0AAD7D2F8_MYCRO|nr:sulfate transporter family-domain-containing protein [Mycena rosella]
MTSTAPDCSVDGEPANDVHHTRAPHSQETSPLPPATLRMLQNDSPLRRAGLLQARSFHPSPSLSHSILSASSSDSSAEFGTPMSIPHTHSQDAIRLTTMELSGMEMGMFSPPIQDNSSLPELSTAVFNSVEPSPSVRSGSITPRNREPAQTVFQPSGLSLLRPIAAGRRDSMPSTIYSRGELLPPSISEVDTSSVAISSSPPSEPAQHTIDSPSESTPLLPTRPKHRTIKTLESLAATTLKQAVKALPAVVLGCLLNILDGVSYGMIIFPTTPPFDDLGPMGVSMFFVSCVVAQLTYTFGGSGFAGANGSMMIEVVPFFHILAASIARDIGPDRPQEIICTTLVAYALSSILTGLSFFLLGFLKLGLLIGFFPRHILVGCIGGVGAFLIETGLTVSLRISDDDFTATWETFKFVFLDAHNLALWTIPLALAVLLRVVTESLRWRHQLVFPLYFIIIPVIFYIVVAAARLDLGDLRESGWVFDMAAGGTKESWYKFYQYYDYSKVQFGPLWATMPTQFALLFFNILHPPLNVPALAVSLNEDVDTDKELVAHGYSNFISGFLGTVPNYLVYVNTLLFYRVGGGTRIAGFLLAVATTALLLVGTGPISFIPVMVVGALIFVLGIDLCKEALWDTRHRVSRSEYITIVSIMVCMTVWDFVIGVLFGIVVSCFFFVVQNSQRTSIRALHTGETAMSTVRRPSSQRAYIREVSKQTTILRLQGFLFFGTITHVEETIRSLLDEPSWQRNPVRFLVLDLSLVGGVDMSSAEAFVRVQRLLSAKYVTLVFCGFSADSAVGKALESVDVLGADGVELFSTFNDAMEWTENAYLRAWFRSQKSETSAYMLPGRQDANIAYQESLIGSFAGSPRRSHLRDAGHRTIANEIRPLEPPDISAEPYNTLVKAFSSYGDVNLEQFRPMLPYLRRMSVPEGLVLWKQDDPADGLYIIESGVLRALYKFSDHSESIEESMVPGTLAGELSALANLPRNASVVVERTAVLWKLSIEDLRRLEEGSPCLRGTAKIDNDILLSALASRQ